MKRNEDVRSKFMESVIRVTAEQGIQNASVREIVSDSGLSEVYIYRNFQGKDDLFQQTFDSLDAELMYVMCRSFKKIDVQHTKVKIGFASIFHDFWNFCLGDKNKCSFFIQYYYSTYYLKHSEKDRKAIYKPILDLIAPAFATDIDVWVELNHMYDIVFPKLLRVIRGALPDNKETEESVYKEIVLIEERNMLWEKVLDGIA